MGGWGLWDEQAAIVANFTDAEGREIRAGVESGLRGPIVIKWIREQAFRRAARVTPPRIPGAPHIPLLPVRNARQGFLSRADFEALLPNLADPDVRDFVEWFWWTGMRQGRDPTTLVGNARS